MKKHFILILTIVEILVSCGKADGPLEDVWGEEYYQDMGERHWYSLFINIYNHVYVGTMTSDLGNYRGFTEGLCAVRDEQNNLWGFINTNERIIIPCQYVNVGYYRKGLFRAQKTSYGRWGYYNDKNEEVIASIFNDAWDFFDDITWVGIEHSIFAINTKGDVLFEFPFDDFDNLPDNCFLDNIERFQYGWSIVYIKEKSRAGFKNPHSCTYVSSDGKVLDKHFKSGCSFYQKTNKYTLPFPIAVVKDWNERILLLGQDGKELNQKQYQKVYKALLKSKKFKEYMKKHPDYKPIPASKASNDDIASFVCNWSPLRDWLWIKE